MISKGSKMITTEWVELPEGNIANVQENYKYLGIPQSNGSQPQPNTYIEYGRS